MPTSFLRSGSRSMLTDLYQLTMAQVYFLEGRSRQQAAFHMHYRKPPFLGLPFIISAGVADVIETIQQFKFNVNDIQWMASLKHSSGSPLFRESFLNALQRMIPECTIKMPREGTVVFPHQPMLTVQGPLMEAQLLETILLNLVCFPSLVATKAYLLREAAQNDILLEFGLRRAQGMDGGLSASRAAFLGGVNATSNLLAGQLYNIPVKGTHAHSFVLSHLDEISAFRSFSEHMPDDCTLLVDTFNTLDGIKNAMAVACEMEHSGKRLAGVRLDSGNLLELSKSARNLLDQAGLEYVKIIASGDLDEHKIKALKKEKAPIDSWGIGTALSTVFDQPSLGGVYKLGAIQQSNGQWVWKSKKSDTPEKQHLPGLPGVLRFINNQATETLYSKDVIYNQLSVGSKFPDDARHTLQMLFDQGKYTGFAENVTEARAFCMQQAPFWLKHGNNYPVELDGEYKQLTEQFIQ